MTIILKILVNNSCLDRKESIKGYLSGACDSTNHALRVVLSSAVGRMSFAKKVYFYGAIL
jgi:hypothetical protein